MVDNGAEKKMVMDEEEPLYITSMKNEKRAPIHKRRQKQKPSRQWSVGRD